MQRNDTNQNNLLSKIGSFASGLPQVPSQAFRGVQRFNQRTGMLWPRNPQEAQQEAERATMSVIGMTGGTSRVGQGISRGPNQPTLKDKLYSQRRKALQKKIEAHLNEGMSRDHYVIRWLEKAKQQADRLF